MRACARVALVVMAVFASLGLAGCASVDELKNVPGIGDKTLETLRPLVTVGKMAH